MDLLHDLAGHLMGHHLGRSLRNHHSSFLGHHLCLHNLVHRLLCLRNHDCLLLRHMLSLHDSVCHMLHDWLLHMLHMLHMLHSRCGVGLNWCGVGCGRSVRLCRRCLSRLRKGRLCIGRLCIGRCSEMGHDGR